MDYPQTNDPLEIVIQSGANFGQTETIRIPPVNLGAMGLAATNIATQPLAQSAITTVDQAIAYISRSRSAMGAMARSMEHAAASMAIATENQAAAYSKIRDADMASHMTELTRRQILTRSSLQMLSVANDSSTIMQLFN
ncbi:Flagellin [compost metagenome]